MYHVVIVRGDHYRLSAGFTKADAALDCFSKAVEHLRHRDQVTRVLLFDGNRVISDRSNPEPEWDLAARLANLPVEDDPAPDPEILAEIRASWPPI